MNHRVFVLGLACLASFATLGANAQGLRAAAPTGSSSPSLSRALSAPLALPTPTASPAVRQADYIVAVVNSEPITHNELQTRLARVLQQLADQPNPPPRALVEREVLERLILEKIQLQQAEQTGIKVDDLAVTQAEQLVASQNSVSREEMLRRLAQDGITPERFRQDLRRQLLQQRLREREVDARVRVTDVEADAFLREQTGGQALAVELNLGHVLIAVPENPTPEGLAQRQALAQQVAEQARAGADFAALARDHSAGPERAQGGLMGLRPAERYPELFATAVQSLSIGGVAGPLRSAAGFHILKVVEKGSSSKLPPITQNRARHILLRASPQQTEAAAAARLADYRRRVLAGQADFADLAREHSQDGSAKEGGDLGWAAPGRYVPEFEAVLEALQPGEISQPLASRFGVHLIQLMERRQVQPSPREQREMARYALREKKTEDAYRQWAQELRARAYVEYRDAP
jgi:peptidyl-prolyl cis-trans isomerase SurA